MRPWTEMSEREKDALIAEKVMGWQRVESPGMRMTLLLPGEMARAGYGISMAASWEHIGDVSVPVATISKAVKESGLERLWRKHARDTLPHYTTDTAAAWQVVERMTDHGRDDWCTFEMRRSTDWHDPTWGYDARFGRQYDPTHQRDRRAWARTAPEAICLAALKARGVIE